MAKLKKLQSFHKNNGEVLSDYKKAMRQIKHFILLSLHLVAQTVLFTLIEIVLFIAVFIGNLLNKIIIIVIIIITSCWPVLRMVIK